MSIITIFTLIRRNKYAKYFLYLSLALAISAGVLAKFVGTSGGEIRHSEIRSEAQMIPVEKEDH